MKKQMDHPQSKSKPTTTFKCRCGQIFTKRAKLQLHALKFHSISIKSFKVQYYPQSITYFALQEQPIKTTEQSQQRQRIQSEKQNFPKRKEKLIEGVGQQKRMRCISDIKKNEKVPANTKTESKTLMDWINNNKDQSTLFRELLNSISQSKFLGEAISAYLQSQRLSPDYSLKEKMKEIVASMLLLTCQTIFLKFKVLSQLQSSLASDFFNYFIQNFIPNLTLHKELTNWMKDQNVSQLTSSNGALKDVVSKFLTFCRGRFNSIQVFDNNHKKLTSSEIIKRQ